jgi:hypothetical protein
VEAAAEAEETFFWGSSAKEKGIRILFQMICSFIMFHGVVAKEAPKVSLRKSLFLQNQSLAQTSCKEIQVFVACQCGEAIIEKFVG